MLSVPDRVSQLRINHVFNVYHGRAPDYISENFNVNQGNTRGASNLNYLFLLIYKKNIVSCLCLNQYMRISTVGLGEILLQA